METEANQASEALFLRQRHDYFALWSHDLSVRMLIKPIPPELEEEAEQARKFYSFMMKEERAFQLKWGVPLP